MRPSILLVMAGSALVWWQSEPLLFAQTRGGLVIGPTAAIQSIQDEAGQNTRSDEPRWTGSRIGREGRERLTPEQIDSALEILNEFSPERAERLKSLREQNAAAFERAMRMTARRVLAMAELKRENRELYDVRLKELRLEAQANRTVMRLFETRENGTAVEADRIEAQLRELVDQQLNFNTKARLHELVLLEEHLPTMRKDLLHDSENFEEFVTDRVAAVVERGTQRRQRQKDRELVVGPAATDQSASDEEGQNARDDVPRLTGEFDPGRIGRESRERLTPEQIDSALEILREISPERAERLESLREKDASAFERAMHATARRVLALEELKVKNRELYDLRLKEMRLDAQVKRTVMRLLETGENGTAADIAPIEQQLRELVEQKLNFNIRARGIEVILMEDHLKTMRDDLLRDSKNFSEVVNARVKVVMEKGEQRWERVRDRVRPSEDGEQLDENAGGS